LAFSGDSRLFAAGHGNNFSWFHFDEVGRDITLWNSWTGEKLHTLTGHTNEILCLAFAPDSKRLASASADHTVLIWENLPSLLLTDTPQMPKGADENLAVGEGHR
jgi:WD40 repeat protein